MISDETSDPLGDQLLRLKPLQLQRSPNEVQPHPRLGMKEWGSDARPLSLPRWPRSARKAAVANTTRRTPVVRCCQGSSWILTPFSFC